MMAGRVLISYFTAERKKFSFGSLSTVEILANSGLDFESSLGFVGSVHNASARSAQTQNKSL
jgi:hypothetical protein